MSEEKKQICKKDDFSTIASNKRITTKSEKKYKKSLMAMVRTDYYHEKKVDEIIYYGVRMNIVLNYDKNPANNALIYACKHGLFKYALRLLTLPNYNINAVDKNSKTAYEYACENIYKGGMKTVAKDIYNTVNIVVVTSLLEENLLLKDLAKLVAGYLMKKPSKNKY